MIFNIVAGFIMPWLFAIYLYFKDKKTLITIAPVGAAIALLFNSVAFDIPLWTLHPFSLTRISFIPFDLGAYPIFASYLVFFIKKYPSKSYLIIFFFTLITTLIEFIMMSLGKVIYYNSWNIAWTFISYLIPYITCYLYYLTLKRNNIA